MWRIFKILNLLAVFTSAYWWITANIPVLTVVLVLDVLMTVCIVNLPVRFNIDARFGWMLLAIVALFLWTTYVESAGMGAGLLLQYLPVIYLIALPREYQADLLKFVTKWTAISLIPALIVYWILLFIPIPKLGTFNMEGYDPYNNYIFYIESTTDIGLKFPRFNAFFPEPGHLSMVCVFLLMANRFDFKRNPWIWVILTAVVFSFSLAGYILTIVGFSLLRINTIGKGLAFLAILATFIVAVLNISDGDNAMNKLIFERLKYDQSKGIEGNNRFFNNTDFEYSKALKSGDYWTGVSQKANMKLISGAGFKIYILQHGIIGILLVLALYLSFIPSRPDWHYTLSFIFILMLCFAQNAYPGWYAWLFPYVLGLRINGKSNLSQGFSDPNLISSSHIS